MKNKKPFKDFADFWEQIMDWDIVLENGTKCKLKDNIKSVKFMEHKKIKNEDYGGK